MSINRNITYSRINEKEYYFSTRIMDIMDVCGCRDAALASQFTKYLFTGEIKSVMVFVSQAEQHRSNYSLTYREVKNA